MAGIITGLDNIAVNSSKNIGENSHAQHAWTHADFEHDMVQLYFQLVRLPKYDVGKKEDIVQKYRLLVDNSFYNYNSKHINYCMSLLFQTRDICGGKGEYALFYALLTVWEKHFDAIRDKFSQALMLCFTTDDTEFDKPYGSWKDVKYILEHWRETNAISKQAMVSTWSSYPLLSFILKVAVNQLSQDYTSDNPSLVARWLPREKSTFGWQAPIFAEILAGKEGQYSTISSSKKRGLLREYRKRLGVINKFLNTIQINQCGKEWSKIDFDKHATSLTLQRQKKAFLCSGKNTEAVKDNDRIECRTNYLKYIDDCQKGKKVLKSKRLSLGEMVKEAWKYNVHCRSSSPEKALVDSLNLAWEHHDEPCSQFANTIACVDTSASMTWENCPYYDAIGIGLKIAERSKLGKRVMTFATQPSWINLEGRNTLTDMVEEVTSHHAGQSTNIYKALELIANACLEQDLTPSVVQDLQLVILSDMQINQADSNWNTLDDNIVKLFRETGLKTSHREAYTPPTIIYWNMRNTNGFPSTTQRNGVVMVSGYSIDVLNALYDAPDTLKNLKPWDALQRTLEANRYSWFW